MADVVTSQTIFDGDRKAIMKFTNVSDGTGETNVAKVTVANLIANTFGETCTAVAIERIHVSVSTMKVNIQWDASSQVPAFIAAPGVYTFDLHHAQLPNNAGTGKTGNITFSTISAAAGATYTIILEMVKHYANPKP